jgi:DNA-directed RNA polymerase specialized sigma24 family protein
MAHASFELLRDQWSSFSGSSVSGHALRELARREASVRVLGCRDLGDLVEVISGRGRRLDAIAADRTIGILVANQTIDPMIAVAVVVTLTPGLKALARRMDWGAGGPWGEAEAFSGELLTTAWEVVSDWSGRRQEFMTPAILTAVRKRLARQVRSWKREVSRRIEWSKIAEPEGVTESAIEELARLLDHAADHVISRGDASLIYAHRVLGLTMVEMAAITGRNRTTLQHRATFAGRSLCA